jgi:hypothetical protein
VVNPCLQRNVAFQSRQNVVDFSFANFFLFFLKQNLLHWIQLSFNNRNLLCQRPRPASWTFYACPTRVEVWGGGGGAARGGGDS